eukprot:1588699-Pyramimonas_sp.AAC.1
MIDFTSMPNVFGDSAALEPSNSMSKQVFRVGPIQQGRTDLDLSSATPGHPGARLKETGGGDVFKSLSFRCCSNPLTLTFTVF